MVNEYQHKRTPSPNPTTPPRCSSQLSFSDRVEAHLRRLGASSRLATSLVVSSNSYISRAALSSRPAEIAASLWSSHLNRLNHK